jgi:hypothetical protein
MVAVCAPTESCHVHSIPSGVVVPPVSGPATGWMRFQLPELAFHSLKPSIQSGAEW